MVTPLPRPQFNSLLGSPRALPPLPMPRYMRPGGYPAGPSPDPHKGGGLLGNAFGWNGNPIYDALKRPEVSDMLMNIGVGLMREPNFGDGLAYGMERHAQNMPYLREERRNEEGMKKALEARDAAARNLAKMGEEYRPLADAVASGAIDPQAGWKQAFDYQSEQKKLQAELDINRRNAPFIKDPDLRAMVEAGAMPFKDAYEYERGGGSKGSYGDTVMLGRDASGNPVPLRTSPDGGLAQAPLPDGITFDPGGMAGARTASTIDAKTQGAAQAALPGAEQNVTIALKAVERLRGNKQGQDEQFGSIMGVIPNRNIGAWKGTEMANFQTDLAQAGGQAFMQARNALKGGGQITDFEGRRAEDAITAMQAAAEKGDQETFNAALDEFEAAIIDGYAKLQQVANGTYQPTFMPQQPGGNSGAPAAGSDYVTRYGLEQ